MPSALKLLSVMVVLGLFVWLALSQSPRDRRVERLNAAIKEGLFYEPEEREEFVHSLFWLASAAGIHQTVRVNEPYISSEAGQYLNVYITDAATEEVTRCGAYNAVYDPELDAVFIDRSFVEAAEWKQILAAPDGQGGLDIPLSLKDVPSIRVLFRFVFLHELGHRQLHRTTYSSDSVERERQADDFALTHMEIAYAKASGAGIIAVEDYTGDQIEFPVTSDLPVPVQVQASVVEMAYIMLGAQFVLPTTASPFHGPDTHPNVVDRMISLIDSSLRRYASDGDLDALSHYILRKATQYREMAAAQPIEIRSRKPIVALIGGSSYVGILAGRPLDDLRVLSHSQLSSAHPPGGSISTNEGRMLWEASDPDISPLFWPLPDGKLLVLSQRTVLSLDAEPVPWSLKVEPLAETGDSLEDEDVELTNWNILGKPWPFSVLEARSKSEQWVILVEQNGTMRSARFSSILSAIQERTAMDGLGLDVETPVFSPTGLYLPFVRGEPPADFVGYVMLSIDDLSVQKVVRGNPPASHADYTFVDNELIMENFGQSRFALRSVDGLDQIFMVALEPDVDNPRLFPSLGVWLLDETAPPKLIASRPLTAYLATIDGMSPDLIKDLSLAPRIRSFGTTGAESNSLLINVDGEGLLRLDLQERTLRTAFPAGSPLLLWSESDDGKLFVAEKNGYKVFRLEVGDLPE